MTLNSFSILQPKDLTFGRSCAELALYKKRLKIEAMGIEYDEEALAAGEYDEILIDG